MIGPRKLERWYGVLVLAFVASIALIPAPYAIQFSTLNLSVDRILLGILVTMAGFGVLARWRITKSWLTICLLFNILVVTQNNLLLGRLQLMSIYTALLLSVLTVRGVSKDLIYRGLFIAFFGYLFWTLYSLGYFFTNGAHLTTLPFAELLPFKMDRELEHATLLSSFSLFPRAAFPLSTPPQLASVAALYALFFWQTGAQNKPHSGALGGRSLFFLTLAVLITLATFSKTGIYVLMLAAFMHFVLGIRRTVRVKTLVVGSLLFAAAVGLVFSIFEYLQNAPVLGAVVQRLVSTNDFSSSVQGGHMDVRLAGIRYFYDMPLFQKIFGIGYLNYESLHFHSSILTSLVETGVLGLLIWAFIFFMPTCLVLPSLFAPKVSYEFQQARFCIVGIFALLLCHLFYEQPYNATLWVFWVYFHLISVQVNRDRADRRKDKIH